MAIFKDERIWRLLTNFWTLVFLGFIIINFFLLGKYNILMPPLSALYVGVLTLYVGTKEFDRWYEFHDSRHPGEIFVAIWSVIVLALFFYSFWSGAAYSIPAEVIADYIAVLSIFALTQKSKQAHTRHRRKK